MRVSWVVLLLACGPDGKPDRVEAPPDAADTVETDADETAAGETGADTGGDTASGDTAAGGVEVPATGARILEDDPAVQELLAARGELGPNPGEELAVEVGGDLLTVAIPAAGDVALSDQTVGTLTGPSGYARDGAVGDLDGDGWLDLVRLEGTSEPLSEDPYEEFFRFTPVLTAWLGPLADDPEPAWVVTLDTVTTSVTQTSVVVDDLSGDGVPTLLFTLGSSPGYGGETGAWRVDAAGSATRIGAADGYVWGEAMDVRAVGDVDGDGIVDLAVQRVDDAHTIHADLHPGPLGDTFPTEADAAATLDGNYARVRPLGDLDGDGRDDVVFGLGSAWIVPGPWPTTGTIEGAAVARIDAEADDPDDSSLAVTAGDVGADGVRDLVVADTYWPVAHGDTPKRGAVYVFYGMPSGTRGARTADSRVYGTEDGKYFGGAAMVLDDGRVAVQGYRDRTAVGDASWAVWLLEGL